MGSVGPNLRAAADAERAGYPALSLFTKLTKAEAGHSPRLGGNLKAADHPSRSGEALIACFRPSIHHLRYRAARNLR